MRLRRNTRSVARARRGASVVEFALLSPVMFLLIFGIIEFGRLMMVQQAMTNAAREACREASLANTINASDVDTVARNAMLPSVSIANDSSKLRITMTPASMASVSSGTPINVHLEVNFADVSWAPGAFMDFSGTRVLSADANFFRE